MELNPPIIWKWMEHSIFVPISISLPWSTDLCEHDTKLMGHKSPHSWSTDKYILSEYACGPKYIGHNHAVIPTNVFNLHFGVLGLFCAYRDQHDIYTYLMYLQWSRDVWYLSWSLATSLMSICIVHIHLSPFDMGTCSIKILKFQQRSLKWETRVSTK